VIRLWGPSWCYGPGGQPSPDAAIAARARAGLPVLDDIEPPPPLPPCLALLGLIGRIDLLGLLGGKR
jgi:hypothetical protein